jgi:hypothetical protein
VNKIMPAIIFKSCEEFYAKQKSLLKKIKKDIKNAIMCEREQPYMDWFGVTPEQDCMIMDSLLCLGELTDNGNITEELIRSIRACIEGLDKTRAWKIIYEELSKKELSTMIYKIIKCHVKHSDLLDDSIKFQCPNCEKITTCLWEENELCDDCTKENNLLVQVDTK